MGVLLPLLVVALFSGAAAADTRLGVSGLSLRFGAAPGTYNDGAFSEFAAPLNLDALSLWAKTPEGWHLELDAPIGGGFLMNLLGVNALSSLDGAPLGGRTAFYSRFVRARINYTTSFRFYDEMFEIGGGVDADVGAYGIGDDVLSTFQGQGVGFVGAVGPQAWYHTINGKLMLGTFVGFASSFTGDNFFFAGPGARINLDVIFEAWESVLYAYAHSDISFLLADVGGLDKGSTTAAISVGLIFNPVPLFSDGERF